VSESPDWKQKYRDSLLEMEAEEKRWRGIEQLLRRLVGRLCAAGMGVNPQLDDEDLWRSLERLDEGPWAGNV
jgi:hypothetical protein